MLFNNTLLSQFIIDHQYYVLNIFFSEINVDTDQCPNVLNYWIIFPIFQWIYNIVYYVNVYFIVIGCKC